MRSELRLLANRRDVPGPSLVKMLLQECIDAELRQSVLDMNHTSRAIS